MEKREEKSTETGQQRVQKDPFIGCLTCPYNVEEVSYTTRIISSPEVAQADPEVKQKSRAQERRNATKRNQQYDNKGKVFSSTFESSCTAHVKDDEENCDHWDIPDKDKVIFCT